MGYWARECIVPCGRALNVDVLLARPANVMESDSTDNRLVLVQVL